MKYKGCHFLLLFYAKNSYQNNIVIRFNVKFPKFFCISGVPMAPESRTAKDHRLQTSGSSNDALLMHFPIIFLIFCHCLINQTKIIVIVYEPQ